MHQMTKVTDPRGNDTTTSYYSSGRVSSQTDRRGKETIFSYSMPAAGGAYTTTVTRPSGFQDVYSYNSSEQATSVTRAAGTGDAATTTYTYDPATREPATVTDPNNHVTTYTYNAAGDVLTANVENGHCTTLQETPLFVVLPVALVSAAHLRTLSIARCPAGVISEPAFSAAI